jgi:hypothetical protein
MWETTPHPPALPSSSLFPWQSSAITRRQQSRFGKGGQKKMDSDTPLAKEMQREGSTVSALKRRGKWGKKETNKGKNRQWRDCTCSNYPPAVGGSESKSCFGVVAS